MSANRSPSIITVDDQLLAFAFKQNVVLEKKLYKKMAVVGVSVLTITTLAILLTIDATEVRLSNPVLVDSDGSTKVLPPILDLENTYEFTNALAERYAMRLMNFHFLKLEEQMQTRRSLFVDDETYERVYRGPLQSSGAFQNILENRYIITAATIRNADLQAEYIEDGDIYLTYRIRLVQTAIGPSGKPETNPIILNTTFKRVPRNEAIEGLLISDLGTISQ